MNTDEQIGAEESSTSLTRAHVELLLSKVGNPARLDLHLQNLQQIDLSYMDLQGANLQGADLQGANLRGINLREANLQGANLSKADLDGADLSLAYLGEARANPVNLHHAKLSYATLRGLDLRGFDLTELDLRNADLNGTDLRNAVLRGADLQGADLSTALLNGPELRGAILHHSMFFNDGGRQMDQEEGTQKSLAPVQTTLMRGSDYFMQNITELATQKQFLQTLVESNSLLPTDIDPFIFLKALLANFASTDGQLRDELTYPIMARIILLEQDRYQLTEAQLEELLLTCIDKDHLFYHIGEAGTDSVFMRSFSSLVFPLVLGADRERPRVSEAVVRRVLEALLAYARAERDWRGYVKGKGWAHSVAHLSDAFDDCTRNRYMTPADCQAILETLTYLAHLPEPLCYEEDDRLAYVAYGIIARQAVEPAFLKKWIASFVIARDENALSEEGATSHVRASNAKNFLRGLYFMLKWSKVPAIAEQKNGLLAEIDQSLQQLNSLPAAWFADEREDNHAS